jgi:hypothetical protein
MAKTYDDETDFTAFLELRGRLQPLTSELFWGGNRDRRPGDLHDGGMVQDTVEHGSGQHRIACECLVPTAECQVGRAKYRSTR